MTGGCVFDEIGDVGAEDDPVRGVERCFAPEEAMIGAGAAVHAVEDDAAVVIG